MTKNVKLSTMLITFLFFFTSCVSYSSTNKDKNHIYGIADKITVLNRDTEEELGWIKITDVKILKDEPFEAKLLNGYDESHSPRYKTIQCSKIVQIFYQQDFKDNFHVTSANFWMPNSQGSRVDSFVEMPKYKELFLPEKDSFTMVITQQINLITVCFNYPYEYQTEPTAIISLPL